jgi:sugar/nucleoside kinase (ribokinase family)
VSTVLVHPGGERTLLTDRGDGTLAPGDLAAVGADPAGLGGAAVLHLDGYDLLPGRFPDAVRAAADTAHAAGVPVSVDVAAANRVRAHGAGAYRELLRALRPDVVLANAAEARVLDLSPADAPLVVVHAGAGPTRVLGTDGVAEVPVPPLPPGALRDTTGCGDALAAGVLAGWRAGLSVRAAVEQGHAAAAAVARVVGGQPPA